MQEPTHIVSSGCSLEEQSSSELKRISPSLLKLLVTTIPVAAVLVDNNGHILQVNSGLCSTLGYSETELINSPIEKLLPQQYHANHETLMKNYLANPRKRQMGAGQELYALRSDGTEIPIEIGLTPIEMDGVTGALATLLDLSKQKHTNRIFRQFIDVAPHSILIINEEGKIEMANNQACACFGYAEDELIEHSIEILIPERYRTQHLKYRNKFTQDPSIRTMGPGRDLTALHRDGTEFPVEIGLNPYRDLNDRDMVMVSLVNITERKMMELELREINTSLEEFTYVASHDLRSPLRGISDLLQWIREDLEPESNPDVFRNLERITVRVQKMEQLIDNLLTYARAGRKVKEIQSINIQEFLDDIVEFLQVPESFNIEYDIELKSLLSPHTPLETVLRNVISNAVKHHDQGSGTIRLSCVAENNLCHFSICDDGPGIPESAIERIFRLFQTVTTAERQNTGIGLSVTRRIVEAHGGRITVEQNTHQRGVTFHIWWPRFIRKDTHDRKL